jgi:hypothetical protein
MLPTTLAHNRHRIALNLQTHCNEVNWVTEESYRMLILLRELAALNETQKLGTHADWAARHKRRKEIGNEIKELAKKRKEES